MTFVATEQEKVFTRSIFAKAGTGEFRYITRDQADEVFAGFGLQPATLDKIWRIADTDKNKFLTEHELEMAVRLMGWVKCSREPDEALLTQVPPLPAFTVISSQGMKFNPGRLPQTSHSYSSIPVNSTGFQITADQCQKFLNTFYQNGVVNGLLSGEKARGCFSKSNLPLETLSRVWHLADTQKRDCLDATDFVIGMFLIECVVFNRLQSVPPTLPPGLYEQARNGVSGLPHEFRPRNQWTGSSVNSYSYVEPTPLTTDYTGSFSTGLLSLSPETTRNLQSPTTPRPLETPGFEPTNQSKWNISTEEKVKYDAIFTQLDSQRRGSIDGSVAAEYMRRSRLPDSTLSRIWDRVDMNRDGALAPDEFALAMHLMHRVLDGNETLADSPKSFVPSELDPIPNSESYSPPTQDVPTTSGLLYMPTPAVNHTAPPAMFAQQSYGTNVAAQAAELTEVRGQVTSARDAVDSIAAARSSLVASNETATSELTRFREQLAELQEQRVSEEAHLATVRAQKGQLDGDLASAQHELLRLQNEVEAIRQKRNQLENELRDVKSQTNEVSGAAGAKKLEVEGIRTENERLESLIDMEKERLVEDSCSEDNHPEHLTTELLSKPADRRSKLAFIFVSCLLISASVMLRYYS